MQNAVATQTWKTRLSEFGRRNSLRPTRIEVLDPSAGLDSDFWIEDGMLLTGIDVEEVRNRGLSVDIMLQATAEACRNHLTHRIAGVTRVTVKKAAEPNEVLEIEDAGGIVTIVRFESSPHSPN
jgi:hypothetical protein